MNYYDVLAIGVGLLVLMGLWIVIELSWDGYRKPKRRNPKRRNPGQWDRDYSARNRLGED